MFRWNLSTRKKNNISNRFQVRCLTLKWAFFWWVRNVAEKFTANYDRICNDLQISVDDSDHRSETKERKLFFVYPSYLTSVSVVKLLLFFLFWKASKSVAKSLPFVLTNYILFKRCGFRLNCSNMVSTRVYKYLRRKLLKISHKV